MTPGSTTARCVQTVKQAAEEAGRNPEDVRVWSCFATIGDHLPEPVRLKKTVGRMGTYLQAYGDLMEDPNFALSIEPRDGWAAGSGDLAVIVDRSLAAERKEKAPLAIHVAVTRSGVAGGLRGRTGGRCRDRAEQAAESGSVGDT